MIPHQLGAGLQSLQVSCSSECTQAVGEQFLNCRVFQHPLFRANMILKIQYCGPSLYLLPSIRFVNFAEQLADHRWWQNGRQVNPVQQAGLVKVSCHFKQDTPISTCTHVPTNWIQAKSPQVLPQGLYLDPASCNMDCKGNTIHPPCY